jgi:hypothetical protein
MPGSVKIFNNRFYLEIQLIQPQRIADNRHRAERHRRADDHRAQENAEDWIKNPRRDRHAEQIVEERKE